ncbi:MAG: glycosyltransferase family 61 protein, partial [Eubacterium sp.]|nr:glycosyltransferase family 61 protein [Eubacterium sp.]
IGKYGLKTVTLEDMTLEEQILTLRNANIVLAEHGASLTNCMFMKSGTCLVDTFGTGFVDMFFVELLNERKIRFRMLVSQAEYAKYDFDDDYVIDPTLMDMALKDATGEWN